MKCFYHPEKDAVGTCSQCGKAACRDCIEDVGGALLCKTCMGAVIRDRQQEQQAAEVDHARIMESARKRIKWSKILFIVIFCFGMVITIAQVFDPNRSKDPNAPSALLLIVVSPFASAFAAYLFWGLFWGVQAVWRWWRSLATTGGWVFFATPVAIIITLVCFGYLVFFVAYMYGALGGGIYEYIRAKKIAAGQA